MRSPGGGRPVRGGLQRRGGATLARGTPDAQDWRDDLGALIDELAEIGGRIDDFACAHSDGLARPSETLAEMGLLVSTVAWPYPEFTLPLNSKSSGALTKIVMALAESLEFRFVQIEQNLEDLLQELSSFEWRSANTTVDVGMNE